MNSPRSWFLGCRREVARSDRRETGQSALTNGAKSRAESVSRRDSSILRLPIQVDWDSRNVFRRTLSRVSVDGRFDSNAKKSATDEKDKLANSRYLRVVKEGRIDVLAIGLPFIFAV